MLFIRLSAVFCLTLSLSACGVTYTSTTVSSENTAMDVTVVSVTPEVVRSANRSAYTPRRLPAAFAQTAGAGGALRGLGALPQAPEVPNLTPPAQMALRVPPAVPTAPYEIGIGDVILLATRGGSNTVEQLSGLLAAQSQRQGYTVRDDGAIAIPEVGAVPIAGLTVEEAEERVFQRLVQNQIDPEFSLEIGEFNSKRVSIGGGVGNSILVPIGLTPLRLDEVVTAAGGITIDQQQYASIRIYRDGTLYQIPLKDYFADQSLQKTTLQDGDSIYVDNAYDLTQAQAFYEQKINVLDLRQRARTSALSELQAEIAMRRSELAENRQNFNARLDLGAVDRDYVFMLGEVGKQARLPLPFENQMSLAEVLLDAGGLQPTSGNPSQIYVVRSGTNDKVIAYHLDARNIVNMTMATKFEMRPNDIVFIKAQPITTWGRALQQALPMLFSAGVSSVSG